MEGSRISTEDPCSALHALENGSLDSGRGANCMRNPRPLDHALGLHYFATNTPSTGGRLCAFVEDFVVEELPKRTGEGIPGEDVRFTLEKRNWETIAAIKRIARALGVSDKRFGYAGNKDTRALTRQRVSG